MNQFFLAKKRLLPLLLSGALALSLLTACARSPSAPAQPSGAAVLEPVTQEVFAMDTYMTVTAYGQQAGEAVSAAVAEIQRLDELWSVGSEDSETSRLNRTGAMNISQDTAALVEQSLALYDSTGGAFDITIYPLMEEWGFTTGNYQVPDENVIRTLLAKVDAGALEYDPSTRQLTLPQGAQLDFGGIAKGYTSGRIMNIFQEYGCASGVVSLGGNAQTYHAKPDGSPWRVGIENPDVTVPALSEAEYVGIVSVEDRSVITSGGYERYFDRDGVRYHHILDPATGYPADSGLISVTIVSEDGCLADGLSTSLFVMGKEGALDYWRAHRDEFDAVLVEQDGSVTITSGLADCFTSDLVYEVY